MKKSGLFLAAALALVLPAADQSVKPMSAEEVRTLERQGKLRSRHIEVDSVEYNAPVPANAFDTSAPEGWKVVER